MSRLKFHYLPLLVLLCLPRLAWAQEAYQFPSGPASWTVSFDKVGDAQKNASATNSIKTPELKRLEVAQTEAARRGIARWSNGETREMWTLPKLNVVVAEEPNGNAMVSRNTLLFGIPFAESDFAWLKGKTPSEDTTVQFEGVKCYHYTGVIMLASPTMGKPPEAVPCEAWIDAETLLPVALLKDNVLGKFKFGDPPESLNMPEKFRQRLEYYKLTMGM